MGRTCLLFSLLVIVLQECLAGVPRKPPEGVNSDHVYPGKISIEAEPTCGRKDVSVFFDERCCGEESYTMGHVSALLKYFTDCNVSPSNKTLNVPQSLWVFYSCLVEKSLDSNEVSPATFVNFMAGSMAESKKAAILEIVEEGTAKDESDKMEKLKKFWNEYFAAEIQVCKGKDEKNNMDRDFDNGLTLHFKSEDAPGIIQLPVTVRSVIVCQGNYQDQYLAKGLNSTWIFENLFPICYLTIANIMTASDFSTKSYDFEYFLQLLLPKYISENSRAKVITAVMAKIKSAHPSLGASPSMDDFAEAIIESHKEKLQSIPEEDKIRFINGVIMMDLFKAEAGCFRGPKLNDF